MHPRLVFLVAIDVVEPSAPSAVQMIAIVAGEVEVERAAQHTFIGRHPLDPLRHASFSASSETLPSDGHKPFGPHAEQRLVRIQRTLDLRALASSGCRKRRVGNGKPGRGLRAHVGIAQQRQNGMVKRRGRKLDGPALRRIRVSRQYLGENLALPATTSCWSSRVKSSPFCTSAAMSGRSEKNSSNQASCDSTCRSA